MRPLSKRSTLHLWMPRFTSPFSYYGAKSKVSHLYPAPVHDTVIEPFAGAACYSFRYAERRVILNDLDPSTASIWRFLTSKSAADVVERLVPS
jgi:site-specific DNA-adenine methylase